jgi:hypothetical protein
MTSMALVENNDSWKQFQVQKAYNPNLGFTSYQYTNRPNEWSNYLNAEDVKGLSDQEFANYQNYVNKSNSRLNGVGLGNNSTSSSSSTDANNSNPSFSWNNEDMQKGMWQQAKDMSQLQLDNTLKTMGASAGYRSAELNQNDEITRRQTQQQFGFQKNLADDNYGFQERKQKSDQDFQNQNQERAYQMRQDTTNAARQAASGAFFGGGNRFNARR